MNRYVRKSDIIRLKERAINRRVNATLSSTTPYFVRVRVEFARIVPANAVVPITLIVYIRAIIANSTEWIHGRREIGASFSI